MRVIITFFLCTILFSCNGGYGIDNKIQTENVQYSKEDVLGKWKLDKFSYKYLLLEEGLTDSIYIIFNKDGSFQSNKSIDLFNPSALSNNDDKIQKGNWKINMLENKSELILTYEKQVALSGLNVFKKGTEYQIWYFLGDPDAGERLRFLKESEK
ncbi:hypothetical protein SAMN05421741_11221 [Paenimyroides ummariense]|uniref:Lipocalin-like domain-containing protein n=1 Tax=Paenimyroides ummariense TaxID=913024 RepID=A0A1I5CBX0_9FLAO|nr:hypothetical protein [Paenimyroides ummariense]SFN84396.1 hypothetical protein SAMN05421741_11221 [Paenimyroides ummariense]